MTTNLSELPADLPVPQDDGAARHLRGMKVPSVHLMSTDGPFVDLGSLEGRWVIYVYPMTGQPGVPLPDGWDGIPGARGCTPQSCAFRDHFGELQTLKTGVFGLSAQTTEYQREVRDRLHLPFQLLSDADLQMKRHVQLPTFKVAGIELYKRLTLVVVDGEVDHVFYPVFPPDQSADEVLSYLRRGEP